MCTTCARFSCALSPPLLSGVALCPVSQRCGVIAVLLANIRNAYGNFGGPVSRRSRHCLHIRDFFPDRAAAGSSTPPTCGVCNWHRIRCVVHHAFGELCGCCGHLATRGLHCRGLDVSGMHRCIGSVVLTNFCCMARLCVRIGRIKET
jgi:hypothetical protein